MGYTWILVGNHGLCLQNEKNGALCLDNGVRMGYACRMRDNDGLYSDNESEGSAVHRISGIHLSIETIGLAIH